jgi:glycerol-3-phosphate cytidylyltransferase-like family protein
MDYKFMDYIKGRSVAEIRAILNNYEVAAIENYWARPDKAKDFSGAMASEVDRLVAQNNGIAVAVFDEESLKLSEAARAEAARLAERFKDSNTFKVVMISREADKSPTEQALDKLRLPRGANVSCVHIFTSADPRTGSPDSAVIHNDIQRYADKGISYVVAKPGDRIDNAVQISMAGMLRSVKSGKPSFIALGDFPSMAFNDIMQLLHSIGGFFKIVRVSEAISEIFRAIRATAVSA